MTKIQSLNNALSENLFHSIDKIDKLKIHHRNI